MSKTVLQENVSTVKNEWKKLKTLEDYGIQDSTDVTLILSKHKLQCNIFMIYAFSIEI